MEMGKENAYTMERERGGGEGKRVGVEGKREGGVGGGGERERGR